MCVAYDVPARSTPVTQYPGERPSLDGVRPRFTRHPGWKTDISAVQIAMMSTARRGDAIGSSIRAAVVR